MPQKKKVKLFGQKNLTADTYCVKIYLNYISGETALLTATVKKQTTEIFDDKLLLFAEGDKIPFAYRAPAPENEPYYFPEERLIDRIGQFRITDAENVLICRYIGKPALSAVIAPLDNSSNIADKAEPLIGYLRAAYSLELSVKDIEKFEELTARLAERCGCLTDIYREDNILDLPFGLDSAKPDSAFIAVCLPIIALMYRRISALRGFNFKITFADGLPCLVFSAKVILSDKDSIIPEQQALSRITGTDGLSFIHRISDLGEECNGGSLFRLSVAICPQTSDPRGILRAPEWKKRTENTLSKIDLDVPGRF
jgi:hypothetical protein